MANVRKPSRIIFWNANGGVSTTLHELAEVDFLPSEVTDQEPEVTGPQDDIDDDEQRFIYFNHDNNDPPPQVDDLPPESQLPDESTFIVDEISLDQLIGEVPSTGNSARAAQEITPSVHSTERPSFSGDSVPAVASPEEIIPLPKIKMKRKRLGRGLKSVLHTSTSTKKHLEEKEKMEREKNKLLKKNRKTRKPHQTRLSFSELKKNHYHDCTPPLTVIPILFTIQAQIWT